MKKNDVLLIISVALYSWLFYHQLPGINMLLFSVTLIVMLLIRNKTLIKDTAWYVAASGSIVSAVCVMLYGTWLAFAANVVSLSIVSALSISRGSSVIMAGIYAVYSYLSSIGFMIVDFIERRMQKNNPKGNKFWIKLLLGIGIFIVIIVFFILYRQSNPLFKDLTDKINLDFISWPWVRFTFLGFLILYGFFYSRNFPGVYRWDVNIPMNLNAVHYLEKGSILFGKKINEHGERRSGVILLALLNVMLLVVNALDIIYLWITKKIPDGMTLSEYLHQGTTTLIISIVFAILIILFYFRGYINFSEKNKTIKWLAFAWLLQNVFMLVSTGYRNLLYVGEYNLTYKRLGIFIWLVLTLIGLLTTLYKLYGKKTNLYLFKANGWAFYLFFVLFACFNWDAVITKFNIQNSKNIDKNYLVELSSPANIPDLLQLPADERDFICDETFDNGSYYEDSYSKRSYYDKLFYRGNYTAKLHKRLFDFLDNRSNVGWQSWNLGAVKTEKEIYSLFEQGKITKLLLSEQNISSIKALEKLKNIEFLDISGNQVKDYGALADFDKLYYLDASSNSIYRLDSLPDLPKLNTLNLSNNYISDFTALQKFTGLENLNISGNSERIDLLPVSQIRTLHTLNISQNEIKNIKSIAALKNLKTLYISGLKNESALKNLPVLPQLEEIDLSNNSFKFEDIDLYDKFKEFKSLKTINLSGNNLSNLYLLTSAKNKVINFFFTWETEQDVQPVFSILEHLVVQSNNITNPEPLKYYPGLKSLDISNNTLSSINTLAIMNGLESLNLSNTGITNFDTLKNLVKLRELNISSNYISDLSSVSFANLQLLNASNNQIKSLEPLKKLKAIRELRISGNQIEDLAPLAQLPHLEILDISSNPINDFSVLYKMKNLKELRITGVSLDVYNELRTQLPGTKIIARQIYKQSSSSRM
ncbi:MAG TPA: DUF4173 domain-containing protein [Bacteroidales bacterium]|nr:DUF4173 domain-containing protein [Bacteroidales bacterium]HQN14947.1 DUF4173 domain-containing protein [Bacteroidales bacterium]